MRHASPSFRRRTAARLRTRAVGRARWLRAERAAWECSSFRCLGEGFPHAAKRLFPAAAAGSRHSRVRAFSGAPRVRCSSTAGGRPRARAGGVADQPRPRCAHVCAALPVQAARPLLVFPPGSRKVRHALARTLHLGGPRRCRCGSLERALCLFCRRGMRLHSSATRRGLRLGTEAVRSVPHTHNTCCGVRGGATGYSTNGRNGPAVRRALHAWSTSLRAAGRQRMKKPGLFQG
jgi:hypothetical protein